MQTQRKNSALIILYLDIGGDLHVRIHSFTAPFVTHVTIMLSPGKTQVFSLPRHIMTFEVMQVPTSKEPRGAWVSCFNPFVAAQVLKRACASSCMEQKLGTYGTPRHHCTMKNICGKCSCPRDLPREERMAGKH